MYYFRLFKRFSLAISLLFCANTFNFALVLAAPTILGVDGVVKHGENIIIIGNMFGSKENPSPVVWDDCSGANVLDKWDGAWPTAENNPTTTPRYTTPIRNVPTAHENVSKYLAGAQVTASGEGFPGNVMVWKNRTITSYPVYSFISWYQRVDPLYESGDNFKWFDFSTRNSPYTMNSVTDSNWYLEYVGGLGNSHHVNDDGGSLYNQSPNYTLDLLGNSKYFGSSKNIKNQWVKIELAIKYTNQNDGWFDLYEDGALKKVGPAPHSYNGATDKYTATTARNEAIGGFVRNTSSNNWRYFNDLYLDWTLARVVIGNSPNYSNCTIREVQPPTIWSNGSISVTVNQGRLKNSSQAYIYIIDSSGNISNGFSVTVGGTSVQPNINAPTGLTIVPNQ